MRQYFTLFTAITKAIEDLQAAQLKAESQTIHSGLFLFENVEVIEYGVIRANTAKEALQKLKYPEYRVIEIPADAEIFSIVDQHNGWRWIGDGRG